jgi:hypothetical protein
MKTLRGYSGALLQDGPTPTYVSRVARSLALQQSKQLYKVYSPLKQPQPLISTGIKSTPWRTRFPGLRSDGPRCFILCPHLSRGSCVRSAVALTREPTFRRAIEALRAGRAGAMEDPKRILERACHGNNNDRNRRHIPTQMLYPHCTSCTLAI